MSRRSGLALVSLFLAASCGDGETTGLVNKPPIARAGSDILSKVGLGIRFDGTASSDGDGTIVSYAWDLGDGTTAAESVAIHTFAAAGTYTARLTVTDDDGDSASDEVVVRIVEDKPPENEAPNAVISGIAEVLEGTEVTLSAEDSKDRDGTIVAWAWNIGGTTATTKSVTHTFATPGPVEITLTVTDDDGATGKTFGTMRVRGRPMEEALPETSTWNWGLVNPGDSSDPNCGPFQSMQLTMTLSGTQLTVREGSAATYTGTYTAATRSFSVQSSLTGGYQSIEAATFTEDFKRFDGVYHVEAFGICNRNRNVYGTRLTP